MFSLQMGIGLACAFGEVNSVPVVFLLPGGSVEAVPESCEIWSLNCHGRS